MAFSVFLIIAVVTKVESEPDSSFKLFSQSIVRLFDCVAQRTHDLRSGNNNAKKNLDLVREHPKMSPVTDRGPGSICARGRVEAIAAARLRGCGDR